MKRLYLIALLVFFSSVSFAADEKVTCYGIGETIPGVPDASKICCLGLQTRDLKVVFADDCSLRNGGAGGYAGVCLACGDGQCDESLESKCNCLEDCAKDK